MVIVHSVHLIAACLCSVGLHESLGTSVSVVVGSLFTLKERLSWLLWIVMFRKLMLLLVSFFMENCIVGIALLN